MVKKRGKWGRQVEKRRCSGDWLKGSWNQSGLTNRMNSMEQIEHGGYEYSIGNCFRDAQRAKAAVIKITCEIKLATFNSRARFCVPRLEVAKCYVGQAFCCDISGCYLAPYA